METTIGRFMGHSPLKRTIRFRGVEFRGRFMGHSVSKRILGFRGRFVALSVSCKMC